MYLVLLTYPELMKPVVDIFQDEKPFVKFAEFTPSVKNAQGSVLKEE